MHATIQHPEAYARATRAYIIANAQKTWRANTARADEIEDAIDAGRMYDDRNMLSYTDDFVGSLARAFDTYGKLSPAQSAAILRGIDARAARRAEWKDQQAALNATRQWLGTVGEKMALTLTVRKIIVMHSIYGASFLHICEDSEKNVVIYKGTGRALDVEEGTTVSVRATIKAHGTRDGVKQTIIARPTAIK